MTPQKGAKKGPFWPKIDRRKAIEALKGLKEPL